MSLNFGQFPTPRLPITSADIVVGYQLVGAGNVPTLAQYTLLQLAGALGPFIEPGGAAGGDLSGNYPNPTVSAVHATSGTIGTGVVVNVTTNGFLDNSTLAASDAFVKQEILAATAEIPIASFTGGTYNFETAGSGAQLVVLAVGGVVQSIPAIAAPGSGYQVGDCLILVGGNGDAIARVTTLSGSGVASASVLYGGTGYTTGATLIGSALPPGSRTANLNGVLTSNALIIIPAGTYLQGARRISFSNNTTGAFTTTVKLSNGAGGSTGVGVVLPQGTANSSSVLLYTDGVTDVWPEVSITGLGLGTMSTQNANAVAITGGTESGVAITGDTINNSVIGGTTPAAGTFTTLNSTGNDALMYSNTSGQSLTSGTAATITNWTKVYDRLSTNFTASSGVFTAPANGFYHVDAILTLASAATAVSTELEVNIQVSGATVIQGFTAEQAAGATVPISVSASGVVQLTSGQTISIQGFQNTGAARTLVTVAVNNTFSIHKIP
jgi:hypothetical protein